MDEPGFASKLTVSFCSCESNRSTSEWRGSDNWDRRDIVQEQFF
jgi:hypothetical protein